MKKKRKNKLIFFIFLVFLGPVFISAQGIGYPFTPGIDLNQAVKNVFNLLILTGGVVALMSLIYAGILYLTSTGKPEKLITAKEQFLAVFLGLLILFSSWLILNTLGPQLLSFEILKPEPIEIEEKEEIPLPSLLKFTSSIDAEVPFGRLIERVLETYISDYPPPAESHLPRMLRIKNNSWAILQLSQQLRDQSQQLKEATDECTCDNADMGKEPKPCCWLPKKGPGCLDNKCRSKPHCTCDPCQKVRDKIEELKQKNLEVIYGPENGGIEVEQFDEKGNTTTIKTHLVAEIKKALEEAKDLKIELKRLERAEKFMKECPWGELNSYAKFLLKKDSFVTHKWPLFEIKFWDDLEIVYLKSTAGTGSSIPVYDFATFYCNVGESWGEDYPRPTRPDTAPTAEEAEEGLESLSFTACSSEAPVGEIIDRAKRTGYKLVERIEKMITLSKDMIKEVSGWVSGANTTDGLHVWVSQCSSKRCYSYCICIPCTEHCCRRGPEGDRCCQCIRRCGIWPKYPEGPCPKTEINNNLQNIIDLFEGIPRELNSGDEAKQKEGIRDVVEGPIPQTLKTDLTETRREQVGIIPAIEKVVPKILGDLDMYVRKSMKECISPDWEQEDIWLSNCIQAEDATIPPEGEVLKKCCDTETGDVSGRITTVFGDCLNDCYLEEEQDTYRICFRKCLSRKSQELNDEKISWCIHRLNFYCCHTKE